MKELTLDRWSKGVQGFRTDILTDITAGVAYVPDAQDLAFRVTADTTYYLGAVSGTVAALKAGQITVINPDLEYTFSTDFVMEIMR